MKEHLDNKTGQKKQLSVIAIYKREGHSPQLYKAMFRAGF